MIKFTSHHSPHMCYRLIHVYFSPKSKWPTCPPTIGEDPCVNMDILLTMFPESVISPDITLSAPVVDDATVEVITSSSILDMRASAATVASDDSPSLITVPAHNISKHRDKNFNGCLSFLIKRPVQICMNWSVVIGILL